MTSMAKYEPKTEDLSQFQQFADTDEALDCRSLRIYTVTDEVRDNDDNPEECEVERGEILNFGNEGFLLKNVLSVKECQHYISEGSSIGWGHIPEARKSYRNCQRIMFRSPQLAEILWGRLHKFLDVIEIEGDPHQSHIHGVAPMLQGKWRPENINPVFRLCRYETGGHFAPHYDGHLVIDSELRSMKTFMIYLNGDFTDGATRFVDESQTLHMDEMGRYSAEETNILCSVKPQSGMALVFNHHRLHEGQTLGCGEKFILRTDIMYRRTEGPELLAADTEALQLVQEAERLEASGENMRAMELYRKAFKLSPKVEESY